MTEHVFACVTIQDVPVSDLFTFKLQFGVSTMENPCRIRELYSKRIDIPIVHTVDEFGFITENHDSAADSKRGDRLHRNEWIYLLDRYNGSEFRNQVLVRKLLQRGIPILLKGKVWRMLLSRSKTSHGYLGICESYLKIDFTVQREKYEGLCEVQCGYEYQIHVDIQRTFRKHYLFNIEFGRGQGELFRLLTAFSNQNPKTGYCQGMSDIGAVFLMHYSEFEAFEMMVDFFNRNKLYRIFDKKLTKLPKLVQRQIEAIRTIVPECFQLIEKHRSLFEMAMMSWHLTFFSRFDIRLCLRIWDYMMFYGFEASVYFISAIIKVNESKMSGMNEEKLIQFIGKIEDERINENEVVDLVEVFMKVRKG